MSDYVKIKAVRLPFPRNLVEKLDAEDCWECEDYLKGKLGDLWYNYKTKKGFDIECTDNGYYLDYILEKEYGADGEYGFAFLLNDTDKDKYVPLFDTVGVEYNIEDLRKVVYCWYNACEAPDCYDVSEPNFDNL